MKTKHQYQKSSQHLWQLVTAIYEDIIERRLGKVTEIDKRLI